MIATLSQDVTQRARPALLTATVGAPAPAVDDLPDVVSGGIDPLLAEVWPVDLNDNHLNAPHSPPRDFFAGCTVSFDLPRYEFPLGPPSPLSRTMADVVREVAA